MTRSEALRRRIIWHLRHVWIWGAGGSSWSSFEKLADEIGAPVRATRREVRRLTRLGRLRYSWMVDDDCRPNGSGYFLEPSWERHVSGREEDPQPADFSTPDEIQVVA